MDINQIQQTYDPSRGTPQTAATVLCVEVGGAVFEGVGLTLSSALENLLSGTKAWRDRLKGIPDGYLNDKTLALKNALNDF